MFSAHTLHVLCTFCIYSACSLHILHILCMFSACYQGDRVIVTRKKPGCTTVEDEYCAWVVLVMKRTHTPDMRRSCRASPPSYRLIRGCQDSQAEVFPPVRTESVKYAPVWAIRKVHGEDTLEVWWRKCNLVKLRFDITPDASNAFRHWTRHEQEPGYKSDDIAKSGFNMLIRRRDFRRLAIPPKKCKNPVDYWLNDALINFYLQLLVAETSRPRFRIHVFNTHFYSMLTRPGAKSFKDGYNKIRRWTRSVDLWGKRLLLVPMCVKRHWSLGVVELDHNVADLFPVADAEKVNLIKVHDSIYSKRTRADYKQLRQLVDKRKAVQLKNYLFFEWKDKKGKTMTKPQRKTYQIVESDAAQQHNACDCGVFTCMYAYAVCHQLEVTKFTQKNAPSFRKHMFASIMAGKLVNIIKYPTVNL